MIAGLSGGKTVWLGLDDQDEEGNFNAWHSGTAVGYTYWTSGKSVNTSCTWYGRGAVGLSLVYKGSAINDLGGRRKY